LRETVPLIVLGEDLLVAVVWEWPVNQQVSKKERKRVKPKVLCVEVLISFYLRVETCDDKVNIVSGPVDDTPRSWIVEVAQYERDCRLLFGPRREQTDEWIKEYNEESQHEALRHLTLRELLLTQKNVTIP
jgi:hypothetical protein